MCIFSLCSNEILCLILLFAVSDLRICACFGVFRGQNPDKKYAIFNDIHHFFSEG